ncbi:MAG: tetratricopeptide repeat protein [Candidatus Tectomicrobia bacterium]|uniref:Tetratricopeptide repeat protein n=1 Tax=Tectimicrobiota bacterium TaxID=2528274 RepID=A0A932CP89_UNCTE|nr:tetratricopeptide repeat protein [Candidatus Tectomicrobia bacterium]
MARINGYTKKAFPLILFSFVLSSCALLGAFRSSQDEFNRGMALFNNSQYEEAIPYFERAAKDDPSFAQAYLYLGRSYLSLGRWKSAVPPLRTALRLSPAKFRAEVTSFLIDALFGLAISDFNKKDFRGTISTLREILALEPQSAKAKGELVLALIGLGGVSLSEGQVKEAISAYTEAIRVSPSSLAAYLGLARAFFKNGEPLKALQSIESAIRIDPTNQEARSLLRELQR